MRSPYLFISHLVADFDYIGGDTILKNFDSLWSLYMGCQCKQSSGVKSGANLTGTLRERSFIRSRAFSIEAGS